MKSNVSADVAFFFADPDVPLAQHQRSGPIRSTLYMVRQDARSCLLEHGRRKMPPENRVPCQPDIKCRRIFPTAMILFAGIDLLAKFYTGSDWVNAKGVNKLPQDLPAGDRFKDFVTHYMTGGSKVEAEEMWRMRSALMHSFGLFDRASGRRILVNPSYGGKGSQSPHKPISARGTTWELSVLDLYSAFLSGMNAFHSDIIGGVLRNGVTLQGNFQSMFTNHGWVKD